MTNAFAPEAASGIPAHLGDMVRRDVVDAQAGEVLWNWPRCGGLGGDEVVVFYTRSGDTTLLAQILAPQSGRGQRPLGPVEW